MTLLVAVWVGVLVSGCSGGPASTAPVTVSASDLAKSDVAQSKLLLDNIERLPAEQRQIVANVPRTAATLKRASTDPATKQRIDSLGLQVK
jgi:hypothetical protein